MAKKLKGMERSSRRQYIKVDNIKHIVAKPNERKSTKSATGNKQHNPSQEKFSKREHRQPRLEIQNVKMTSTELLHSISGGIIESGIKYIMFPLHFLRFCIFGTNLAPEKLAICEADRGSKSSGSSDKKTNKEEKENVSSKSKDDRKAKNDEASNRKSSEESLKNKRSGSSTDTKNAGSSRGTDSKEIRKGHDDGLVERPLIVVVEEDSDSSSDRWSTASSTMIEDVTMVSTDRSISFDSLVEPMDVSIEEYAYERSQIVTGSREKQHSTLSLDSEMARIFQMQCTSSDDEYSSSNTLSEEGERPGGKNFLCRAKTSHSAATVPLKSKEEEVNKGQKKKTSEVVDKERKKKTSEEVSKERKKKVSDEVSKERKKKVSSEDVTRHKRRKVSQEENTPEKQRDGKSDAKRREEKQSSKLDIRNKSKTRSPKTSPVKSKESKRQDVKYKEIATQTDSAFSDDDVEMIPVDAKLPERRYCCKHTVFRSHPNLFLYKGVGHDSNYAADNEDSNDGFARIARKRVSSSSTSSSSTDLGFDEQGTSPESDIRTGRWHAYAHDTITNNRMCSRAPPGFPRRPQNPPLLSYTNPDWYKVATTSLQNNPYDAPSTPTVVPRAPAPMRHLYYDYPEFMDLPTTANSSNVLDIVRESYYR